MEDMVLSTVKNVNKLFDALTAKDFLLQKFNGFLGESKVKLAYEGIALASSILHFIFSIKDEIAKSNENKRAFKIINSRFKKAIDLAIEACRALEDDQNWDEYNKLIKLRGQVAKEILDEIRSEG
ncbi:Hypothetical protein BCO_0121700 (plasmid) [Borrelia coriaceae ATCC 43381]|uniref:Uncharacterized protein n=1 Tax=Borrelia coriaceae ATCC 43381 TaxID=1408429 RepID=W5SXS6_9SPIR|nr:Hypothetical protein BCO_0121700 [Borrelia coriaceae ATCC 43381]